ncbi:MAG: hypothetical protein M3512_01510 [Bacteroidota bacterium]|nr:hypothetical protein [Bacteroidota bacterium]
MLVIPNTQYNTALKTIDLCLRWAGKKIKYLNFQTIQYHLYHKLLDREEANRNIFEEVLRAKEPFVPQGIREL